jgi:TM2 domain-containing membrane protein YozV
MSEPGPGSTSNVIAALASFFIPGLGQLVQGRLLAALLMFVLAIVLWPLTLLWLGWVMHVVAAVDAAMYRPQV